MKTSYKLQASWKKARIARAKAYLARVNKGESMADIGRAEGISRQRVRTLIQSLSSADA